VVIVQEKSRLLSTLFNQQLSQTTVGQYYH